MVKRVAIAPKKGTRGCRRLPPNQRSTEEAAAEQGECPQALADNALKHFERIFDYEANLIQVRLEIGCTGRCLANAEGHVFQ